MRRNFITAAVLTLVTAMYAAGLMSACSSLGLPSSTTFNAKLATAYTADTQVLQTTTSLLQAKVITADDAANVEKQADVLKAALDIARVTYATDQATGSNKLAAAVTALTALQTYLGTKKGGGS